MPLLCFAQTGRITDDVFKDDRRSPMRSLPLLTISPLLTHSILRNIFASCTRPTMITTLRSAAWRATSGGVRRAFSTSRAQRDALVYLEHRDGKLNAGSLSAVTAASQVDGNVVGLVAGADNVDSVIEEAKKLPLKKLLLAKSDIYNHHPPSTLAPLLKSLIEKDDSLTHLFAVHSAVGKNVLPRAAALLDTSIIADILGLEDKGTQFTRGIYAGNAISTIKSSEAKKVVTVRGTAFDPAAAGSAEVAVEEVAAVDAKDHAPHVKSEMTVTARPDLGSASRVVSGGRALKSAENFNQIIEPLADKLGAAIGASRAAVDSGYADNSLQVGQTGKIVAPELYMAIGISGAIQHLAGMKDSKLIVAVNKDPEAPIFQVADVGLVADLFEAVPEITKKLDSMSEGEIRRRASYSSNLRSILPSEIASHLPSATSSALDYLDLNGTVEAVWNAGERLQRCFFDVEERVRLLMESNATSKKSLDVARDLLRLLGDLRSMDREKLQLPSVQSKIEFVTVKLKSVMAASPSDQAQVLLDKWDEIRRLVEGELQDKAQLFDSVVEHGFDSAKKSIERALSRAQNGARLIQFSELPDAWKNNEHILTGYRFIPLDNKRELFLSAFKWHNETVNVQTHLWAAVGVTALLFYHVAAPHPVWIAEDSTWSDKLVMVSFLLASLKCLVFSSLWHIHAGCADKKIFDHYACVDYVGISSLITATVTGVTFYGLYCDDVTRNTLLTFIISNAVAGSYLPFTESFNKRESRAYRIGFFVYMAFCGAAPIVAMVFFHGLDNSLSFLAPMIPSLLFYIVGLVIYAFQIPECFAPGRFDFAFASHNAWHIAVAAAIFLHYRAIVKPPPEARQLGPPTGPSILKNPISSQISQNPSHERRSSEQMREAEPPRKMSIDSISFAPLPQRPSSMPRRNSITLGVAARSSFFNGSGNGSVRKNSDGSMVKTFTAEEWKQLEESQGRNVVDLGDVAMDAGKKFVRLFKGRRGSKDRSTDKDAVIDKTQPANVGKDDKKLEDVGEEAHEEDAELADADSSVGTLSPNTSQSHISQTTTDTSYVASPPPDSLHMRASYNDLHPYKRSSEQEDENLKQYALGFDPARLSAKRQQM
ncbi:hypothetical protein E3P99_00093 [Wallemia hederae]|uniref:Probable electron transfer flavoprotein subunit alpha, mitochondrial n=1 Tax=Wallemia hederae TaxID=1540922 RepID=A0A4T0FXB7_9BASI|nr:hypothetical protein E3P99_00093 [Wallemia hederae]